MKAKLIDDRTEIFPVLEQKKEEILIDDSTDIEQKKDEIVNGDSISVEQKKDDTDLIEAIHDTENNTITITLLTGEELTIKEPKGKDFLEAEAWIGMAGESRQSPTFLILKLALICATFRKDGKLIPKPKIEDFLDLLDDYDSMEAVGRAIGFFRERINGYFKRLETKAKELGLDLPK